MSEAPFICAFGAGKGWAVLLLDTWHFVVKIKKTEQEVLDGLERENNANAPILLLNGLLSSGSNSSRSCL